MWHSGVKTICLDDRLLKDECAIHHLVDRSFLGRIGAVRGKCLAARTCAKGIYDEQIYAIGSAVVILDQYAFLQSAHVGIGAIKFLYLRPNDSANANWMFGVVVFDNS